MLLASSVSLVNKLINGFPPWRFRLRKIKKNVSRSKKPKMDPIAIPATVPPLIFFSKIVSKSGLDFKAAISVVMAAGESENVELMEST